MISQLARTFGDDEARQVAPHILSLDRRLPPISRLGESRRNGRSSRLELQHDLDGAQRRLERRAARANRTRLAERIVDTLAGTREDESSDYDDWYVDFTPRSGAEPTTASNALVTANEEDGGAEDYPRWLAALEEDVSRRRDARLQPSEETVWDEAIFVPVRGRHTFCIGEPTDAKLLELVDRAVAVLDTLSYGGVLDVAEMSNLNTDYQAYQDYRWQNSLPPSCRQDEFYLCDSDQRFLEIMQAMLDPIVEQDMRPVMDVHERAALACAARLLADFSLRSGINTPAVRSHIVDMREVEVNRFDIVRRLFNVYGYAGVAAQVADTMSYYVNGLPTRENPDLRYLIDLPASEEESRQPVHPGTLRLPRRHAGSSPRLPATRTNEFRDFAARRRTRSRGGRGAGSGAGASAGTRAENGQNGEELPRRADRRAIEALGEWRNREARERMARLTATWNAGPDAGGSRSDPSVPSGNESTAQSGAVDAEGAGAVEEEGDQGRPTLAIAIAGARAGAGEESARLASRFEAFLNRSLSSAQRSRGTVTERDVGHAEREREREREQESELDRDEVQNLVDSFAPDVRAERAADLRAAARYAADLELARDMGGNADTDREGRDRAGGATAQSDGHLLNERPRVAPLPRRARRASLDARR